ncbi:MAG: collagen binding domain-containing protein, partial [bacterium]
MIRARSSVGPRALAGALLALLSVPVLAASRIMGRVTDAESQRPIANAEVELRNSGGGPGFFRARTDAQGEFAIEAVPAERGWQFTVAADGYTDWALESWQFPAAQREVRLAVPLDRAGRLVVTALGRDGRPLEGARVGVRRERGNQWWETYRRDPEPRFTDREGRATFEGLAAGPWSAAVDAPGLRPDEVRALPVRRGETTPASITLVRPASLAGVVRRDDSSAVAGATVVVRGPSEGVTTTDADGAFVLEDLAPGRYRVELAQDGFETGTARDGVVLEEGRAVGGIALVARPRARQLAFVLERDVFVPQPTDDGGSVARVALGVRAFRIAALDLVLRRVPLERLTDGRVPGGDVADTVGLERVAAWTHELPAGSPFAWRET